MFRGLRQGAGGRGKRTAAACGHGAPARHCAREKAGEQGKKAGDDAHLHTELRRRAGATKRRDGGVPELDCEGGGTARVAKQGGGGCGMCGA
jgi:hypothetical protein